VKDFLDGITDASLQPVKFTIAGFPNLMNSFTEASNYIGQIVDLNKKTDAITRSISSVTTDGKNNKGGNNNGGRGKGGRGGQGGRGGRGRGKGRGRGNGKAQNAGRWISSEEWSSMPDHDKDNIRNQRSQYAAKRKLSAVTSSAADDEPFDQPQEKTVRFVDANSAGDQMSRRNRNLIGQVRSGKRYTNKKETRNASALYQAAETKVANAELDSHADTVVAGSTCKILEMTEKSCDVYPYSDKYDPISNVPIAKVATAYDHPVSGETFILVFGQALFMGDSLEHTLICPNQARSNGIIIDDIPRHLSPNRTSTHSIYFPTEDVRIPLRLNGIISCIETRLPTDKEIQDCRWLIVTNDLPWEPASDHFAEQESYCQEDTSQPSHNRDIYSLSSMLYHNICAVNSGSRKLSVSDAEIARIFNCGPTIAKKTRLVTTQKGLRSFTSHLTRRYKTKQAALRYDQLGGRHGRFYSDTFFSSVKSLRGNTMGQLFVNDVGYYHFTPMKHKSEAGDA